MLGPDPGKHKNRAAPGRHLGHGAGAQAGQTELTQVIKAGGFSKVLRAAETQVNMVLEARPSCRADEVIE